MIQSRSFLALAAVGLLALGGCVAYPGKKGDYAPVPVFVAPLPGVYLGDGDDGHKKPKHGRPWGYRGD